jgi:hypothetical protein
MFDLHSVRRPSSFSALIAILPALAAAALSSGCGSSASAVDPVAQAAQVTSHAGGASLAISGTVSAPGLGAPVTISGGGRFNFATEEGIMTLAVGGLPASAAATIPGGSIQLQELLKSGEVYISSPLLAGRLPGGARWLAVDLSKAAGAAGLDPSSIAGEGIDPGQYLQYLQAHGGTSTAVGHDLIRGVQSTHYHVQVDLLAAAEAHAGGDRAQIRAAIGQLTAKLGRRTLPLDVWIDRGGLVRRIAISLDGLGGTGAGIDLALEFFAFGPTAAVTAPASSEVLEMNGQALSGLSGAGG